MTQDVNVTQASQAGGANAPQSSGLPRAKAIVPASKMRQLPDQLHLSSTQLAAGGGGVLALAGVGLLAHQHGGIKGAIRAGRKWAEGAWNSIRGKAPEAGRSTEDTLPPPGSTVNPTEATPTSSTAAPEPNPYAAASPSGRPPGRSGRTPHEPSIHAGNPARENRPDLGARGSMGFGTADYPSQWWSPQAREVLLEDTAWDPRTYELLGFNSQVMNTIATIPRAERPAFTQSVLGQVRDDLEGTIGVQRRYTHDEIRQAYGRVTGRAGDGPPVPGGGDPPIGPTPLPPADDVARHALPPAGTDGAAGTPVLPAPDSPPGGVPVRRAAGGVEGRQPAAPESVRTPISPTPNRVAEELILPDPRHHYDLGIPGLLREHEEDYHRMVGMLFPNAAARSGLRELLVNTPEDEMGALIGRLRMAHSPELLSRMIGQENARLAGLIPRPVVIESTPVLPASAPEVMSPPRAGVPEGPTPPEPPQGRFSGARARVDGWRQSWRERFGRNS